MPIPNALRQRWRGLIERVRSRLVDECKGVWRRWSVQLAAVSSALSALAFVSPDTIQAIWNALPPEILDRLPRGISMSVPLILSVATLVAAFIKQEKTNGE